LKQASTRPAWEQFSNCRTFPENMPTECLSGSQAVINTASRSRKNRRSTEAAGVFHSHDRQ
jgi:hypothetical protein